MACLVAINYDPAAAVTKAVTALLAMTAFDTTNARAVFNAPASGAVTVRIRCVQHGATNFAQILLGVLQGATVIHRQAPVGAAHGAPAATIFLVEEAVFTVRGLTAGASYTWDAAYGVEVVSAASGAIKYGGPNNATTAGGDAFGALTFEVWDA